MGKRPARRKSARALSSSKSRSRTAAGNACPTSAFARYLYRLAAASDVVARERCRSRFGKDTPGSRLVKSDAGNLVTVSRGRLADGDKQRINPSNGPSLDVNNRILCSVADTGDEDCSRLT